MKKNNKQPIFKNRHGEIAVGTDVSFMVENQDQWAGDLSGTLVFEGGEFKIKTERSGVLTIDKGHDIYFNTIQPV